MSFWCWLIHAVGSCTLASRLTPRRSGLPSNSAMPSRGTPPHGIFCAVVTDLRGCLHQAGSGYGHQASAFGTVLALAACLTSVSSRAGSSGLPNTVVVAQKGHCNTALRRLASFGENLKKLLTSPANESRLRLS
jgi:hypothetical protein